MKSVVRHLFLFILVIIFFNSCDFFTVTPLEPTKTISFEEIDDDYIHYSTNDISKYTDPEKYMVPNIYLDPFTEISVEMKKDSGYAHGDYGVIFAYIDSMNYYQINIDTLGKYTFKKMYKGTLSQIKGWTPHGSLIQGYGKFNTIIIKMVSSQYKIYFNSDINAIDFDDNTFTKGKVGFFVFIGSIEAENFPFQPVDVSFKLISPTTGL